MEWIVCGEKNKQLILKFLLNVTYGSLRPILLKWLEWPDKILGFCTFGASTSLISNSACYSVPKTLVQYNWIFPCSFVPFIFFPGTCLGLLELERMSACSTVLLGRYWVQQQLMTDVHHSRFRTVADKLNFF